MQFNLSSYIRILKSHSKSTTASDEQFVADLFDGFVVAFGLENKNKLPFKLDKFQVSKLLTQESDVPAKLRKIVNTVLDLSSVFDGFEVFVESTLGHDFLEINVDIIDDLISKDPFVSEELKRTLESEREDAAKYLFRAYIEALKINNANPKTESISIWSRGNSSLRVIPANLITKAFPKTNTAQDIVVVIPVNTSFETEVTPSGSIGLQLVSENTIHGKWLNILYGKQISKEYIDGVINESLTSQGIESLRQSKSPIGKQALYPVGTVAVYKHNRTVFYLWAISEFDEKNRAQSTQEIIKSALDSLLEFYDAYGQGADMYIPLVGTGRSRANMTHQESYNLIKSVVLENENKVHGNITIVVLPDDYEKIKIF